MVDELITLKEYDDFIKITENKRNFYGGNQSWFKDEKNRKAGCGAVAVANITAYISKNTGDHKLYKYSDFSKPSFINHMENVVEYVKPKEKVGILRVDEFIEDSIDFAKSRGVRVKGDHIIFGRDYISICDFIKESLNEDIPVGFLMLRNDKLKEFDYHWMTITKYYENDVSTYIIVSTWGEKRIINLKDVYNFSSFGAFVKFTVN